MCCLEELYKCLWVVCSHVIVLGLSVRLSRYPMVRGMRGVGGVCMCLARGGVGGELLFTTTSSVVKSVKVPVAEVAKRTN